ncbi:hypothetical protein [Primorskyibacter sp. S87]|uniref:hypothetical protein n=1 Tax=Primorskyibacter sp. S87 TaxID=3415126 RepID=UPI003C7BC70C
MTPEQIEEYFTRSENGFVFARWSRPIAPVAFGVKDETLGVIKGAFEAVAQLAGHKLADTDPDTGSNCMIFFFQEWDELLEVPDLDKAVPNLAQLVERVKAANANQYRLFSFNEDEGIKSAFIFLKMDEALSSVPAETMLLGQAVQAILLWKDSAFNQVSAFEEKDGQAVLRHDIATLIAAAYDPTLPAMSRDPSHALRLHARISNLQ